MTEPLSGITVVELTIAVQGPAAALYLRDMGAEVIKVEPPLGDPSRYGRGRGNELEANNMGPQFVAVNRGKRSVCMDLATELGLRALHELLADADVILTNYRAPALAKMGLSFETLHPLYPNLIYANVNGFGPLGPDADKAMLDGAAVTRGGLAHNTGHTDLPPSLPGAIIGDTAGAMHLALGVMTALYARAQGAGGQQVQTSALGTQLWLQQWELTHTAMTGAKLARHGSHHPIIKGPYGIYLTKCGGAILIAQTMTQEDWDAFCVFGRAPELAVDPRLQTPGQRLGEGLTEADSEEIRERLRTAFAEHTALEWDDFLRTLPEVIWERLRDWHEVLEDPQSLANDYIIEVQAPDGAVNGPVKTVGNLVSLSATPGSVKGDPPSLGEGTRELLLAKGLSAQDISEIIEHADKERVTAFAALLAAKDTQ